MALLYPSITIVVLSIVAFLLSSVESGRFLIAILVPYAALAIFIGGFCWRVAIWAASPVPFRIPTTCGQQKSLPWIKSASLDNPASTLGVVGRMTLEILLFRSLFRNNRAEMHEKRYHFGESKLLWLGALAFHFSLLIILLRHLRLMVEPVPGFIVQLGSIDSFFQIGLPPLYITDLLVVAALGYLLLRRLANPLLRYISQFSDYFAPLLLLGIAVTGGLMRYVTRVDVVGVKRLALGLATLHPVLPEGVSSIFFVHLLLVSCLAAYFPFSKLMHLGGAFLSPTRNLANNSRRQRHINPWNYPVKTHPYPEWEAEFHDKLKMAGIPLDEAENGR